jgi:hypothetical protein
VKYTPLRLLALSSIVSLGATVALLTSAAPAKALTISPPSIEFGVQPGQQANLEVKLYNEDQTQAIEVTAETTSWTSGTKPGEPQFAESATADEIAKWIQVGKGPFKLDPQARLNVPVTVDVPATATVGGHYGAILFTFKNPKAPQDGQILITPKVATLFLVRVDGPDVREAATIAHFGTADGKTNYGHLPISFTTTYQNTGNIHLKPQGKITITNSFGKLVATLTFNDEKGATLPASSRVYNAEVWQVGTVKPLTGNAWSNFWTAYSNEKNNFAIGKFTASIALDAGTVKPFSTAATTTFMVIPWHILIVYGLVIVIFIILLIVLIRKYNAWILKRSTPKQSDKPNG